MRIALPPGPPDSVFSQTRRWIQRPTELLDEAAAKYGDVFTLRLVGIGPMIFVQRPDVVRAVFASDPDEMRAGRSNVVLLPLLGKHSVLLLDGPAHRRQRRLLLPPFHGERMRAYTEVMRAATRRSLERWPRGTPFAVHPFLAEITLEVILRAVFGIDAGSAEGKRLGAALAGLLDAIATPILLVPGLLGIDGFKWMPFLPHARFKSQADRLLREEIARRRAAGGAGEDVLSLLLQARDEEGNGMTDEELHHELLTLLVAGHETTATSLAWTLQCLLRNPATLERARAELAGGADPAKAEYLDAVTKESLRLRPVLPIVARTAQADAEIGGVRVPKGRRIVPCIYLVHRRPDLYPEPAAFRPERFLTFKPAPEEWLPFGGGNRRCLGAAFALHEMKVVLATLLAEATLEAAGQPEHVTRRSITFAPSRGSELVLTA